MTILAIDAALRETGLALLDGRRSRLATIRYHGERDDLPGFADHALANFIGRTVPDPGIDLALVEWPPRVLREREGRPVRDMARELGFACGAWVAAARAVGSRRIVTVEVGDWRRLILGEAAKGGPEAAKRAAEWRATAWLAEHGLPPATSHHEAEAVCLGLYGLTGCLQPLPVGNMGRATRR